LKYKDRKERKQNKAPRIVGHYGTIKYLDLASQNERAEEQGQK
jgi:hypothetical protein